MPYNFNKEELDAINSILVRSASNNTVEAMQATNELALALQLPLRQGVLTGDILQGIFEVVKMQPGARTDWPLDPISPGTERDFVAYTIPSHGRLPERNVEGDYVMVPTFEIGNSIDWLLRYARDARWDVVGRCLETLRAGFVKKMNDDGWHTLLAAGYDRNILAFDSDAEAGQFTKRLVSVMKTLMRRNGGGNSNSMNRGKLTDLYMSPEGLEDVRNWGVDQIDELTRKQIYDSENTISRIFGVNIHDIDELGESQEYQLFYSAELSGTYATDDVELVVGLDQASNDSFVMPVVQDVEIYEATDLFRHRRGGLWGTAEVGFGVLDNRRVLLGSF